MSEKIQKFILLMVGVLAMSFAIGYLVFAWVEPGANPPQGNVPAPINVGTDTQTKLGGLNIATQIGNVGVGTTTPSAKLHSFTSPVNLAGNQTNLRIDALGSFDTSAGARYNYAAYINASPTKSAGASSLYNYGIYLQAQGGDYSYGIYTSARNASTINRALYTYAYGGGTTYGIYNYSYNTGSGYNYGIYNYVSGVSNTGGNNFGLYSYVSRSATVSGLTINNYAIYGYAGGSAVAGSTVNNWGLYIAGGNAYFAGNVGIGATDPGYQLDVNGALRLRPSSQPIGANGVIYYDSATNKFRCYQNGAWVDCIGGGGGISWPLLAPDGSAGAPSYSFTNNSNMGMFRAGANILAFSTGGTERLRIDGNGNVGIGTPSPAVAGLHIGSGVSGGQAQLRLDNANGSWGGLNRWTDRLEIISSNAIGFSAGGTIGANHMWITSDGNVGIGKSPSYKLDVNGVVSASTFRTRSQTCPSGWSCEVNTWDIAAQSIRAYGHVIADGLGSFNGADSWSNFVTSKTGYGDTIGIGGDSAGGDTEIRINAPASRNKIVLWNSNLGTSPILVAPKIFGGTGAMYVTFLDIGNADGYPRYVYCMQTVAGIDWTNYAPCGEQYWWVANIYGYLYAPTTGTYNFRITSDDGAVLYIDGTYCAGDWEYHGATTFNCSRNLTGGNWYPLFIQHFQGGGDERLKFEWQRPGASWETFGWSYAAYPPFWGFGIIGAPMPE